MAMVQEKLGDKAEALKLLQDTLAALSGEAPVVLEADALVAGPGLGQEIAKLWVSGGAPKGRFEITVTEEGLRAQGASKTFQFQWTDVLHFLKLPKWEHSRKAGAAAKCYWLVLVLEQAFSLGKQQHQCLVLNANGVKAPEKRPVLAEGRDTARQQRCAQALENEPSTAEATILSRLLAACLGRKALEPESSACSVEAVPAWADLDEGHIYPLSVGLCFLPKPAIFVPGEDMLQAEAGPRRGPRGGDLILHRVQSKQVKFQQISAGDMNALLSYISALASQYHPSEARADDQNLEDDEDDSDFEDEVVGTTNPPAKRRAVTRSQTSGKAAGVTPVLVQDLPAPSRGKAEKEEDSDADDLGEGEESDIEDVE